MVENNTCRCCRYITSCAEVTAKINETNILDEIKKQNDCPACERYEKINIPHGKILIKQDGIDDDFQIVACSHGMSTTLYLFEAPIDAELKKNDEVLVETRKHGKQTARVWYSVKMSELTDEAVRLLLHLTNARLPLCKVIGKYIPFTELPNNKTERKVPIL